MANKWQKARSGFLSGIRGRLTFWFVFGAVGAVTVGGAVVYLSGLNSIQGSLGQTYCQIADRIVGQADSRFIDAADRLAAIATDVLTTEVAIEAGDIYNGKPNEWRGIRLARLAREWAQATDDGEKTHQLHQQLSYRLSVVAGLEESSLLIYSVYDRHGLLVGASTPPAKRVAADEAWYRIAAARNDHFILVDVADDGRNLAIATPIWGGVVIVGYAMAVYDLRSFVRPVESIQFGRTGEVAVVDSAGVSIGGIPQAHNMRALAHKPAIAGGTASAEEPPGSPYWIGIPEDNAWPLWHRLVCVAPLQTVNGMRAALSLPAWAVTVTQSPGESYAALSTSLQSLAFAGAIGVLAFGFGGAMIAYRLSAPLKDLQTGVRLFARGDRDSRVKVESADEIGELAEEFNRMAERITESEHELRAFAQAVEDATDVIVMADPTGNTYYVNPAFETVTGYRAEEACGRDLAFLKSEKTPPETYDEMRRAMSTGAAWRGELWNRRRNGEDYPIDLSISPIYGEDGRVVSQLGIHRDITLARTYRDALEREVEARTREIAETEGLTAMGRMASMIAHDLRNALSTIKMNLQILARQQGGSADAGEHCDMSLEQVAYMEEIMHDMLSFARPEKLRLDWHDASRLMDDALATMLHTAEKQGVEVVRRGCEGLPKVYCDRIKFIEVVRNLAENALQAMPGGGMLTIEAMLLLETPSPVIRFEIGDTGDGIDEATRPQMFEPFFTTRSRGSGLGLAIVKRIVLQHGGEVGIDSAQSSGAKLWFTLPMEP